MATWRSGYAEVCKTSYPGSIPGVASKPFRHVRLQVPVVVGYLARDGTAQRPYSLHIEAVAPNDAVRMQRDCLAKLERGILMAPEEWLWMASVRSGLASNLP